MTTVSRAAEQAMIPDVLPLDRLTLIGIFAKPGGNSALLRPEDGNIVSVAVGDRTLGLTITAIGDDAVHLVDATGTPHVMQIPAG